MVAPPLTLDGRLMDGLIVIGHPDWVKSLSFPRAGAPGGMGPGMGRMGGQGMM
jgi:hypothetical protein